MKIVGYREKLLKLMRKRDKNLSRLHCVLSILYYTIPIYYVYHTFVYLIYNIEIEYSFVKQKKNGAIKRIFIIYIDGNINFILLHCLKGFLNFYEKKLNFFLINLK